MYLHTWCSPDSSAAPRHTHQHLHSRRCPLEGPGSHLGSYRQLCHLGFGRQNAPYSYVLQCKSRGLYRFCSNCEIMGSVEIPGSSKLHNCLLEYAAFCGPCTQTEHSPLSLNTPFLFVLQSRFCLQICTPIDILCSTCHPRMTGQN